MRYSRNPSVSPSINVYGNVRQTPYVSIPLIVEYLVIAGGGGGGGGIANGNGRGGGGAGGYLSNVKGENTGGGVSAQEEMNLIFGNTYRVTVGGGGAGGLNTAPGNWPGTNGSNSMFNTVISIGGGGGATVNISALVGGSGGGGSPSRQTGANGTINQGYKGGNARNGSGSSGSGDPFSAGGGGGAFAVGANATISGSGNGGDGVASSVTGSSITRAGGGGGGADSIRLANSFGLGGAGGGGNGGNTGNGSAGTVNTGGGGGGSSTNSSRGGAGGSGIVILKYPNNYKAVFSSGVTQSTSTVGDFKVSTITATSTTSETVTFA